MTASDIERVLAFWFGAAARARWFDSDPEFDRRVRAVLGADHARAAAGGCADWMESARGCLALVVLLDQVPRNIYRGEARAYATDEEARAATRHALARGYDRGLTQAERMVLHLPLEHGEDPAGQEHCVRLMAALDEDPAWVVYARAHRQVIARFGRFPHRNAVLGRATTAEEAAFLETPGAAFDGKAPAVPKLHR